MADLIIEQRILLNSETRKPAKATITGEFCSAKEASSKLRAMSPHKVIRSSKINFKIILICAHMEKRI